MFESDSYSKKSTNEFDQKVDYSSLLLLEKENLMRVILDRNSPENPKWIRRRNYLVMKDFVGEYFHYDVARDFSNYV